MAPTRSSTGSCKASSTGDLLVVIARPPSPAAIASPPLYPRRAARPFDLCGDPSTMLAHVTCVSSLQLAARGRQDQAEEREVQQDRLGLRGGAVGCRCPVGARGERRRRAAGAQFHVRRGRWAVAGADGQPSSRLRHGCGERGGGDGAQQEGRRRLAPHAHRRRRQSSLRARHHLCTSCPAH